MMAEPNAWQRFKEMRARNQEAVRAANKPNMLGVRPQDTAYEEAPTPVSTFTNFVENRRAALGAPGTVPPSPPELPQPPPVQTQVSSPTPLYPNSSITRFTHDIGDQQLRTYTTPQGSLSGMVPAGRGRGGFVGAATDAEAARNLQARAVQDQAARGIAQNTDRTIESMRDLRAEQMGIPRGR